MDKKELKWYVTPAQEIIEAELEEFLCTSPGDGGIGGGTEIGEEDEE
jgi:hypothetical protein